MPAADVAAQLKEKVAGKAALQRAAATLAARLLPKLAIAAE
ncbi:MAG: hypothetical protein AB7O62_08120 [Pirellulales bacterium]